MPRRQFIDKKNATTFALVHRAQNDPLINDQDASPMVFAEISGPSTQEQDDDEEYHTRSGKKIKQRGDLDEEFGLTFKANEGQAAEHGVFFDDTRYDYMQHMRDLGSGEGQVTWVPSAGQNQKGKGKGKQRLEDALRDMDIGQDEQSQGGASLASSRSLLPEDVLGSEFVKRTTYQDQQDVPDALRGFHPDMDPRLREVMEALEDEAYVDEEDSIFEQLAADQEVDEDEWEAALDEELFTADEDDAGWESDHTIRPNDDQIPAASSLDDTTHYPVQDPPSTLPPADTSIAPPADPTGGAWLEEFDKFKNAKKQTNNPLAPAAAAETVSAAQTGLSSLASGRRKKRKGAKTSTTNYSMSSASIARTELQDISNAQFDKLLEREYGEIDDERLDAIDELSEDAASLVSGQTGMSKASSRAPNLVRAAPSVAGSAARAPSVAGSDMSNFSGISSYSRNTDSEAPRSNPAYFFGVMDDFLDTHTKAGKRGRHIKKGVSSHQTGMDQLDEVRKGLGKARLPERMR